MALAAWSLKLAACPFEPEAWSLKLFAIDKNPGAKLLPAVAHDFELSCYGRQLAGRCVANFNCEFFSQVAPYIVWESTF